MGLDQWLYKKTYVQNWEHQRPEERHEISVKLGGVLREDIRPDKIAYIVEQAGYWRKFNALHGWIVENCAGGIDECQKISLSRQDLQDLLDTLNIVSSDYDRAEELLPPTAGFFFGSTEVDEYYIQEVERTKAIIEELINEDVEECYYQASW
jgi:hypothetical protein